MLLPQRPVTAQLYHLRLCRGRPISSLQEGIKERTKMGATELPATAPCDRVLWGRAHGKEHLQPFTTCFPGTAQLPPMSVIKAKERLYVAYLGDAV